MEEAIFRIQVTEGLHPVQQALGSPLLSEDLLYHFTRLDTALEHILPSRTIRLGPLHGTNDPLESDLLQPVIGGAARAEDMTAELILAQEVMRLRRRALLACFCMEKLEEGRHLVKAWKRVRMWAQYAEVHRGVCLVFHKGQLKEAYERQAPQGWEPKSDPIRYCEEGDLVGDLNRATTFRYGDSQGETAQAWLDDVKDPLLFSKLADFRDEAEWRMALVPASVDQKPLSHFMLPYGDSLKAVIIGCNFPKAYLPSLRKDLAVPVFQVTWNHANANLRLLGDNE